MAICIFQRGYFVTTMTYFYHPNRILYGKQIISRRRSYSKFFYGNLKQFILHTNYLSIKWISLTNKRLPKKMNKAFGKGDAAKISANLMIPWFRIILWKGVTQWGVFKAHLQRIEKMRKWVVRVFSLGRPFWDTQ